MEGLTRYETFVQRSRSGKTWIAVLILVYAAIFTYGLRTYLQWQSINLMLGVIAICTTCPGGLNEQSEDIARESLANAS